MKYNLLKFVFLLCFVLPFGSVSYAQVEGTMPFMSSLPQVTYYNPAFKPQYKFSIGLPFSSVFMQYSNNGFAYNDVVMKEGNLRVANLDKLNSSLRDQNYINTNFSAEILRMSLKANARLYLTFNVSSKVYSRIMLPKDLFGIIKGTNQYVNSTATLSPKLEATSYVEIGTGAAYTVNKDLTVGARFKFLKGVVNATTQRAAFNLSMSEEYAMTISGDADIRTSGYHNFDDSDSDYEVEDNWRDFTSNNGFAVDLGATYNVNDKLTVGVSLLDLGGITWKNDLYGYSLDPAKARYTFEGLDLDRLFNDDDGDDDYEGQLADSLEAKFDFEEGRIGNYRTPLPAKMYLTASYKLKETLSVGALIFAERFRGRLMTGFTASLNKEFGRRVGTSLSYTITNNSYNNIGAGLSLNFAPIQIYFVGDNILRAPFALMADKNLNGYVNSLQYFTFRTGINFVFGRDKVQEKQSYPKN